MKKEIEVPFDKNLLVKTDEETTDLKKKMNKKIDEIKAQKKHNPNYGGRRPGSGRKLGSGTAPERKILSISFYITDITKLKAKAKEENLSLTKFVLKHCLTDNK